MDSLLLPFSSPFSTPFMQPNFSTTNFSQNLDFPYLLSKGYFSPLPISPHKVRKSVVVVAAAAKKSSKNDRHSFVPKPDEATGVFPEAVLLKEKKVQEDGTLRPEFADAEEEELYESLNLLLESDLNVERMRHYEVVYLIHENYANEVESINLKVQDFLREKKGRVWRFSDWGMRRLAYKIQKAKNAHYILMNFELEAKCIDEFKTMLDKDERVIRHLVIKRDKAITEDCPPPPEFHTIRGDVDDDADDMDNDMGYDEEYDDEEYEDEEVDDEDEINMASFDGDEDDAPSIIYVDDDRDDDREVKPAKTMGGSSGRRNLNAQKVGR